MIALAFLGGFAASLIAGGLILVVFCMWILKKVLG